MKIKKITALILAMVMAAAFAVPVFATSTDYTVKPNVVLSSYKVKYGKYGYIAPGTSGIEVTLEFESSEEIENAYIALDQTNFIFTSASDKTRKAKDDVSDDELGENGTNIRKTITVDATRNIPYGGTTGIVVTLVYYCDGELYSDDFLIPVNVVEEPEEEEEIQESTLTPHLFITGYSVSEEPIEAGKDFNLTVNFRNTSKTDIIENVIMTFSLPAGMALSNASNKFYFTNVPAGGSASQTVAIESDGSLADGLQNIGIDFDYQFMSNDIYTSGSDSDSLSVRVGTEMQEEETDRFEISSVDLPDTVYVGQEEYITINLINKGSKALNNVSAKINSENISNDGYNEYLGQIQANSKGEIELVINPSTAGDIIGTLTVSYEHDDGTVYELTRDFTVYCEDPNAWMDDQGYIDDTGYIEPETNNGIPALGWVCIAVAGAAAITGGIIIAKRIIRKKKEKALEESLDEDI